MFRSTSPSYPTVVARMALAAVAATLAVAVTGCTPPAVPVAVNAADRDLLDVTVPKLEQLYADKRYTVTQVVQWHLDRIDRYNGVYGAIETVLRESALAEAARLDAEAVKGNDAARGRCGACPS